MRMKKSVFTFLFVIILCTSFTSLSEGIELNPTKEQIEEAVNCGKASPGDIFRTEYVSPATFGNWPEFGGGLVKSKLIQLAVVTAMKLRAKKQISEEEIDKIMQTKDLDISYRVSTDVYKIKLRQGTRIIEPKSMVKRDRGGKDPVKHVSFFVASFPYSKLDIDAETSVIVEKDFGTKEFLINFSRIK